MDYAELIDRLERLPVNEVTRSVARAELVASESGIDRIIRVLAYLEQITGKWGRVRGAAASKSNSLLSA